MNANGDVTIDCFIFYFDVIGVVKNYLKNPKTIDALVSWQSQVRDNFSFGESNTTCKTMFDNVWCRITSQRPEQDIYTLIDFAAKTMQLARQNGFENYFGVITYGQHTYNPLDRTLVSGGDVTDMLKQHIDSLSETHIRAAFAEKWSSDLHKLQINPSLNSVWISKEALFDYCLDDMKTGFTENMNLQNDFFDLNDPSLKTSKNWPFGESEFCSISI